MLQFLAITSHLWADVTLDFVTSLPINNSYNAFLILVNCLIKEKNYILYTTDDNGIIKKATHKLLFYYI